MRKALFVLLAICVTVIAQAQIPKNATLIGGQFSLSNMEFTSNSGVDNKTNSQTINLSIGKAIRENKIYGITASYLHWKSNYPELAGDTVAASSNGGGIGLFFRQYKKLASKFYLFGQVDLSYFFSNEKRDALNAQTSAQIKTNSVVASITPGLSYQIFKKVHAELTLPNFINAYYSKTKNTKATEPGYYANEAHYGVNATFTNFASLARIGIGFNFIF